MKSLVSLLLFTAVSSLFSAELSRLDLDGKPGVPFLSPREGTAVFVATPTVFGAPGARDVLLDIRPVAAGMADLWERALIDPTAVDLLPGGWFRPVGRLVRMLHTEMILHDRGYHAAVLIGRSGDFAHLTQRAGWTVRLAVNW